MGSSAISQGIIMGSLLRVFHVILIVALSIGAIALSSCSYHPWKVERYVNEKTEYINPDNTVPDGNTFAEFYIENNFVLVGLTGKDETLHSGKGPYDITIGIWKIGNQGRDDRLCLKDIKIHSTIGKLHDPIFSNPFPLTMNFPKATYDDRVEQSVAGKRKLPFTGIISQEPLDLDFNGGETVVIDLVFELVRTESTSLQKTIRYQFKPKLEKGNFIWITA